MAGKRKNPGDAWMPPRVYRGKSSYEWHPMGGGSITLCPLLGGDTETEATKAAVWAAYAKAKETPDQTRNMQGLITLFHKSAQFAQLSLNTKADYNHYSKRINRVFGDMLPTEIKPPHIRQFMDAMAAKGIIVQANRHHSYLSVLFGWGIEHEWCETNPAKQVRKFREAPRDRYIEDWEYVIPYDISLESSYPYLAPMMEIAYLCRARSTEVLKLTEHDLLPEGIYLKRAKKSASEITGWTDRLRKAIALARSLFPDAPIHTTRPLIHDKTGKAIPREAFKTAWGRIMNKSLESGKLKERFTFHDIKAKGVTDHADKASGHKTKKMQAVYDRKPSVTMSTK